MRLKNSIPNGRRKLQTEISALDIGYFAIELFKLDLLRGTATRSTDELKAYFGFSFDLLLDAQSQINRLKLQQPVFTHPEDSHVAGQ